MRACDNPFAVSRVMTVRYRMEEAARDTLMQRLWGTGRRAAIVGAHGSGKTTLLEDMEPRLSSLGYQVRWIRLSEERPALDGCLESEVDKQDFILLDGAEQLRAWSWHRFLWQTRQVGGMIITSHQPGRLPTLHRCVTDEKLLADIITQLVGEENHWTVRAAPELFARHRGNIREALRELYDRCAAISPRM